MSVSRHASDDTSDLLNDHLALVFERFKVGLQCQVIVQRLDILWQDLSSLANVQI